MVRFERIKKQLFFVVMAEEEEMAQYSHRICQERLKIYMYPPLVRKFVPLGFDASKADYDIWRNFVWNKIKDLCEPDFKPTSRTFRHFMFLRDPKVPSLSVVVLRLFKLDKIVSGDFQDRKRIRSHRRIKERV
ncbi:hypothetical protein [Rhizobium leguminosarum]|uniref:hypothetical protein n=1 Tax=Rhizobium leguminosarum TaxID=384 RepID=UPI001C9675CA|nr:hypothetical protein [Rhizobium leguminosarum]MBY5416082.1 hypothetical protein [Rhizobium leguminosarum]